MNAETQAALALIGAGLPSRAVERVLRALDLDSFDDAATIAVKVDELKEDMPGLFEANVTSIDPRERPPRPGSARGATGDAFARKGREALDRAGIRAREEGTSPTPMADAMTRAQDRFDRQRRGGRPPGGSAA